MRITDESFDTLIPYYNAGEIYEFYGGDEEEVEAYCDRRFGRTCEELHESMWEITKRKAKLDATYSVVRENAKNFTTQLMDGLQWFFYGE